MHWYLDALQKYAVFEGRARRKAYWMYVLFNMLFSAVFLVIDNVSGLTKAMDGLHPLNTLYSLAVFLPGLGLAVRRLHDTGHSGWHLLIVLIPCIGPIVFLVWMVTDGDPATNAYGADPKAPTFG